MSEAWPVIGTTVPKAAANPGRGETGNSGCHGDQKTIPAHKNSSTTLRFNARERAESMIEMANLSVITKVSRVFLRIYAYTARWNGSSKRLPCHTRGAFAMKYFSAYFCGILIVLAGNAAAQTRIYTKPEGRLFTVDGVAYTSATTYNWAPGTKHVLATDRGQDTGAIKTIYAFQNWQYTGGLLSNNPIVTVTADPALKEFYATFTVQHALSLNFASCARQLPTGGPADGQRHPVYGRRGPVVRGRSAESG